MEVFVFWAVCAVSHSTWPSTPLIGFEDDLSPGSSVPSTPFMSPMPPDPSDVSFDRKIEKRSTYSSPMANHSPDGPEVCIYETSKSDWTDNSYRTDDDLSELEGDELEESLMRQRIGRGVSPDRWYGDQRCIPYPHVMYSASRIEESWV